MPEIAVSPATPTDVPDLVDLMESFYAESSFALDRRWAADSFTHLLSMPSLGSVWLARAGDLPVGHAVLSVRYTMEHAALGAYIDDLYVVPAFRRRRVASRLLSALVDEARHRACASMHVEVGASNAPAVALYERFGLAPATDDRLLLSGPLRAAGT